MPNLSGRKTWGPNVRRAIWEVQDRCCFYCSKALETWTGRDMHLDHVDPFGKQGADEIQNLVAACVSCNLEKSDKSFEELLKPLEGKLPGQIVAEQLAAAKRQSTVSTVIFYEPHNERREEFQKLKRMGKRPSLTDPMQYYLLPEFVKGIQALARYHFGSEEHNRALLMEICQIWEESGRPYFNIYPVVVDALSKTRLEITPGQVCKAFGNAEGGVAVCFAVGDEPRIEGRILRTMCIAFGSDGDGRGVLHIVVRTDGPGGIHINLFRVPYSESLDNDELMMSGTQPDTLYQLVARVAVGVLLLAQDERFVEPILLARDRHKTLSDEQRETAVKRAINRTGMRGHTIGRDWMASPHVRLPHFAIRWTGKGRTTPRLVPVKGTIVRRSELLDVPTGFKDYSDEPS